jgi:hypothetical protein
MGLEGIISKRADAPYRSGRGEQWLKVKRWQRDRFAVIGFVPEGSSGLLKLRLARREGRELVYVGRVGTGWDRKTAGRIRRALEPLARPTPPLAKPLKKRDRAPKEITPSIGALQFSTRPSVAPWLIVYRQAIVHVDQDDPYASGFVLHEVSADEPRHPASLTKIMTLYLLFEQLEDGKLNLDTPLPISTRASVQNPTKLGLKANQTIRVEDAIKGLVTKSANDAAVVVAEAIGGSEDEFAKLMTLKARTLGMTGTIRSTVYRRE